MRERLAALAVAYRGLLRAGVQVELTYRGRILIGILTGVFPLLLMAVWLTVVDQAGPASGWDTGDFVSYYVAAGVLWHVTNSSLTWEWDADLRSGELSAGLMRPVDPFHQYAAMALAQRVVLLSMLLPVVVAVAALVPLVRYPLTPALALGTALAVATGFALAMMMSMAFALVGFWTTQAGSLYSLWWGLGMFASGWIAPLDLMPAWLRAVALALPFRSTIGFPIELLLGRLGGGEVALGFAVALAWLGAFALAYRVLWRRGLRRYQAVGG